MSYFLDTNVISEFQRLDPYEGVVTFLETVPETDVYLSVISVIELHRGAAQLPLGRGRRELEAWLMVDVHERFGQRILGVDGPTAVVCGRMLGARNLSSGIRRMMDFWLAAIAVQHDLTLVTRNVRDFQDTGVRLLNPWEVPAN